MNERPDPIRQALTAFERLAAREVGPGGSGMPVDEAVQRLTQMIEPLGELEQVPLAAAYRRVLAADLLAPIDVPAYDNSAMDGFAIRLADLANSEPTCLKIAGRALAGQPYQATVPQGAALQIMTGACLPPELDTVVPVELCRISAGEVHIPPGQKLGQHCRKAGEDMGRGTIAVAAGRLLGAADVGLIASLGIDHVTVRRRPRVVVLSTGDELLAPGEPAHHDRIFDSNRFTLLALLREFGIEAIDAGIVRDDPQALRTALASQGDADLILSSGGVSVGEADFTRQVMSQLGQVTFATLAIRPGRPLAVGRIGQAWYFGLPGNPVAVMVTYLFVVRAALLQLMGTTPLELHRVPGVTRTAIRKRPGRTEYQRAVARRTAAGTLEVELTGQQGSGILSSMARANCMVVLPAERGDVAAGDTIELILFDGLI